MPGKRAQGGAASGLSVDSGADELYGLPPDRFIAARNELVKQAKAARDPQTAAEIARLAKPNAVAWLANQLVRAHRGAVDELLELGATLREATAALDAGRLRELTAQQRREIADLIGRAKQLASSAGQAVSDATVRNLEDTLHAALADPDAADALVAGRLTAGLESSGFPGMALAAAAPSASKKASKPATKPAKARKASTAAKPATESRELQRADDDLAAASDEHDQTAATRDQAQQAADAAEAAAEAAAQEVERLSTELDEARQAQRAADKARRQAVRALADAERAARQAAARLERAAARRAEIAGTKRR